jgi:hypothetical protein
MECLNPDLLNMDRPDRISTASITIVVSVVVAASQWLAVVVVVAAVAALVKDFLII